MPCSPQPVRRLAAVVAGVMLLGALILASASRAGAAEADTLGQLPLRVADTELTQGMWVWHDTVVATAAQRQRLLDFCVEIQVNHLVMGIYFDAGDDRQIRRRAGHAALIEEAAQRGITVAALRGARDMAFRENHDRGLAELDALLAFNEALPSAGLVDLHYDIEPYLTDRWRAGGEERRATQVEYLDFLHLAAQRIDAAGADVTLSVDVAYWFDKPDLALTYRGVDALFSEHIQNATDFVTLMSYHRDAARVIEQVAGEAAYAERIGKHVHAGMEVGTVRGEEHFISFHWVPRWRFWQARYVIEAEARQRPGLRGLYLHHYPAIHEKLTGEPPW
jgi:hypothetical protein